MSGQSHFKICSADMSVPVANTKDLSILFLRGPGILFPLYSKIFSQISISRCEQSPTNGFTDMLNFICINRALTNTAVPNDLVSRLNNWEEIWLIPDSQFNMVVTEKEENYEKFLTKV